MLRQLPIPSDALRGVCARYHVMRLDVTGSLARGDFDPTRSDIDLLVEFSPGASVSAIEFMELTQAIERIVGRRVDLIELQAVTNPILRAALIRDRTPFYAAA